MYVPVPSFARLVLASFSEMSFEYFETKPLVVILKRNQIFGFVDYLYVAPTPLNLQFRETEFKTPKNVFSTTIKLKCTGDA